MVPHNGRLNALYKRVWVHHTSGVAYCIPQSTPGPWVRVGWKQSSRGIFQGVCKGVPLHCREPLSCDCLEQPARRVFSLPWVTYKGNDRKARRHYSFVLHVPSGGSHTHAAAAISSIILAIQSSAKSPIAKVLMLELRDNAPAHTVVQLDSRPQHKSFGQIEAVEFASKRVVCKKVYSFC